MQPDKQQSDNAAKLNIFKGIAVYDNEATVQSQSSESNLAVAALDGLCSETFGVQIEDGNGRDQFL
jgi:hypothetical protein